MRSGGVFWRALATARRANLAASGALPPLPGSPGMTRRRVLGVMAAGAALPAVGCAPLPSVGERTRVAIVGGGLAGLTALRLLTDAGVDARLYEARSRLGGRVFTYRDGPVPADDGGQFINSDHADILALARRYKLSLIDRDKEQKHTLVVADGRLIDEGELAEDLRPIAARIAADAQVLDGDDAAAIARLDAMSVSAYLDAHADALAKPHVRALMDATIRTEFGQEPDEATAIELVWNLPVVGGRHVEVIGSSDERFVLAGGSGMLPDAMARDLLPAIELGQVLESVRRAGDGVRLRFADGRTVEAERAIVTVPAPLLRTIDFGDLLPPLWAGYAAQIDCGRNEKLNAVYDGQPWRQTMGRGGSLWSLPGGFAEGWDAGTVESELGLFTWFMGGAQCAAADKLDAGALRHSFETQAAPAVPGFGEAATPWQRRTHWGRDRFARGGYSCFRPGQLTRFSGLFWLEEGGKATQSAVAGPLVFAGEHLSDAWPGYMNGGAQTGRLAAQAVLGT